MKGKADAVWLTLASLTMNVLGWSGAVVVFTTVNHTADRLTLTDVLIDGISGTVIAVIGWVGSAMLAVDAAIEWRGRTPWKDTTP